MALPNFTAGTAPTTTQMNNMVAAINANTNGFADSGWLTDLTTQNGFSVYNNSAMVRIDTNSIVASGTMYVNTAPTTSLTTDLLVLGWGTTSSTYMTGVKSGLCGSFVSSAGVTGMMSINTSGLLISYRSANPAAGTYIKFSCSWLQT